MGKQHEASATNEISLSGTAAARVVRNLSMTPEADEILADLSRRTGLTEGKVIRFAIAMFKAAVDAKDRGDHIGIATDPNAFDTELVGF